MRFLVDQCLSPEVAEALATNGHDAVHLRDLGMMRAKDPDVLALARAQQRDASVPVSDSRPLAIWPITVRRMVMWNQSIRCSAWGLR